MVRMIWLRGVGVVAEKSTLAERVRRAAERCYLGTYDPEALLNASKGRARRFLRSVIARRIARYGQVNGVLRAQDAQARCADNYIRARRTHAHAGGAVRPSMRPKPVSRDFTVRLRGKS